jgi:hypothetical protein
MTAIAPPFYYPPLGLPCWPLWNERLVAATAGDQVASMLRQIDADRANGADKPLTFAEARIDAAKHDGTLNEADAMRLKTVLYPGSEDRGMVVSRLFQEAFDDPESSPATLSILSVLQFHAQQAATENSGSFSDEEVLAIAVGSALIPGFALGVAIGIVASHLTVGWE